MKYLFLVSTLVLFLAGCASTPVTNYSPTTRQISEPPIGSINVANLGDELLTQGTATERQALYVPTTQKLGLGASVTQGLFPKSGEKDGFEYFATMAGADAGTVKYLGGISGAPMSALGVLALRKSDNAICFINGFNVAVGCTAGLNFEKRNLAVTTNDNSFQQTLLYNGKVGNKINIAYREFSSNLARPAFNNDVEYDLSQSNQIGYKGALLEVIDANNQTIKYKVIKNFNTK